MMLELMHPRHQKIEDLYDNHILDYESDRLDIHSPVEYEMTLRTLDRWIQPEMLVADIGVGVGHYAQHLAQKGCKLELVDIAQKPLKICRRTPCQPRSLCQNKKHHARFCNRSFSFSGSISRCDPDARPILSFG